MDPYLYDQAHPTKKKSQAEKDDGTFDMFSPAPFVASETSKEAALSIDPNVRAKRMTDVVNLLENAGRKGLLQYNCNGIGLARFEIAQKLGVPDHYLSSTFDRLLKLGEIVETTRKVTNPATKKSCFVLVHKRYAKKNQDSAA